MKTAPIRLLLLVVGLALLVVGCRADDDEAAVDDEPDDAEEVVEDEPDDEPDEADEDDEADEADEPEEADDDGVAGSGPGVTDEPCPDGVNDDNGCIYLGSLNDLTVGAFAQAGPLIQDAIEAFWGRVNEDGGIGGFDVDIASNVRDNEYVPEVQTEVFGEIRDEVLSLGLSLGSSPTLAIRDDLEADDMFAVPMAWNSDFPFDPVMVESGSNYCVDSMNAVDFYVAERDDVDSVMSVHYPNDYGQDADVGVRLAADAQDAEHIGVQSPPGPENQGDAIQAIAADQPDLVVLTLNPTDSAAVVGEAVAAGYEGFFIGHGPTWNVALLDSPAADALRAYFWQVGPYPTYDSDTPGHEAMRETLGDGEVRNDFHTAGWVSQYPVKAALEGAVEEGTIDRATVLAALQALDNVDYEGMLPPDAGNFAGEPNDRIVRGSNIGEPDDDSSAGLVNLATEYVGPTAEDYDFTEPCRDSY